MFKIIEDLALFEASLLIRKTLEEIAKSGQVDPPAKFLQLKQEILERNSDDPWTEESIRSLMATFYEDETLNDSSGNKRPALAPDSRFVKYLIDHHSDDFISVKKALLEIVELFCALSTASQDKKDVFFAGFPPADLQCLGGNNSRVEDDIRSLKADGVSKVILRAFNVAKAQMAERLKKFDIEGNQEHIRRYLEYFLSIQTESEVLELDGNGLLAAKRSPAAVMFKIREDFLEVFKGRLVQEFENLAKEQLNLACKDAIKEVNESSELPGAQIFASFGDIRESQFLAISENLNAKYSAVVTKLAEKLKMKDVFQYFKEVGAGDGDFSSQRVVSSEEVFYRINKGKIVEFLLERNLQEFERRTKSVGIAHEGSLDLAGGGGAAEAEVEAGDVKEVIAAVAPSGAGKRGANNAFGDEVVALAVAGEASMAGGPAEEFVRDAKKTRQEDVENLAPLAELAGEAQRASVDALEAEVGEGPVDGGVVEGEAIVGARDDLPDLMARAYSSDFTKKLEGLLTSSNRSDNAKAVDALCILSNPSSGFAPLAFLLLMESEEIYESLGSLVASECLPEVYLDKIGDPLDISGDRTLFERYKKYKDIFDNQFDNDDDFSWGKYLPIALFSSTKDSLSCFDALFKEGWFLRSSAGDGIEFANGFGLTIDRHEDFLMSFLFRGDAVFILQNTLPERLELEQDSDKNKSLRSFAGKLLRLAIKYEIIDVLTFVAKFLNGAMNKVTFNRDYVLHYAFEKKCSLEALNILLENGADPGKLDSLGYAALHKAALLGNIEFVRCFLENGVSLDSPDNLGNTPLNLAIEEGWSLSFIKELIEMGANLDIPDLSGVTPLHRAAIDGKVDVMRLLIDRDCKLDEKDGYEGRTPLHYVAQWVGKMSFSSADLEFVENAVDLLIKGGADVNFSDNNGKTALDYIRGFEPLLSENLEIKERIVKMFENAMGLEEGRPTSVETESYDGSPSDDEAGGGPAADVVNPGIEGGSGAFKYGGRN